MKQLPTAAFPVYNKRSRIAWKIIKKTGKYCFYFVLFYFSWKGFISWK